MSDLDQAIATVVHRCLGVQAGEEVLVIADPGTRDLGDALRAEAEAAGGDAVLALISERDSHGAEPPSPVAEAMLAADAYIAPTTKSLSHTRARKAATEAGARGATLPGVTADMLARVMAVDFDGLRRRSGAVAELLEGAGEARLTCPRGTDMRFDLSGRTGISDDGDLTAPGAFGNLPCGEGFIAPAGGEGRLFPASLASIGLAEDVELTVSGGHATAATGEAGARFMDALTRHGNDGTNLAELGVGTNERATLTGNVLEDEKMLGSVHVAFGASAAIGGSVSVPVHLDVVVLKPTLDVSGTTVLTDGRFILA